MADTKIVKAFEAPNMTQTGKNVLHLHDLPKETQQNIFSFVGYPFVCWEHCSTNLMRCILYSLIESLADVSFFQRSAVVILYHFA